MHCQLDDNDPSNVRFAVVAAELKQVAALASKTAREVSPIRERLNVVDRRLDVQDNMIDSLRGAHESSLVALRSVAGAIDRLDGTMAELKSDLKDALVDLKSDLSIHKQENEKTERSIKWVALRAWIPTAIAIPSVIWFITWAIYTIWPYAMQFLEIKVHIP